MLETIEDLDFNNYELIIFDCDGTLVDSEKISNRVIGGMLRDLGIKISDHETYLKFSGTSFANIMAFVEEQLGAMPDYNFEQTFRPLSLKEFKLHLQPIEGSLSFLKKLTIPFCVASNGPREKMRETLPIAGFGQLFDENNMFSAYDINIWKPEPDLFLMAAKKMSTPPNKCLVVEDTISGAMGAVNAGIDVIVLPDDRDVAKFKELGIPRFESFKQLESLLTAN